MITSLIRIPTVFQDQPTTDMFVRERRPAKSGSYVANTTEMEALTDLGSMSGAGDVTCRWVYRNKSERRPYLTESMVRFVFQQSLPDACTLQRFKPFLAMGALGGRAIFEAVSQLLRHQGYMLCGRHIVEASSEERQVLNEGKARECEITKRRQNTNCHARWTKKHGKSCYGHKVNSDMDVRWKLPRRIAVVAANMDDGPPLLSAVHTGNALGRLLADLGHGP